jgi:hypothetical protein
MEGAGRNSETTATVTTEKCTTVSKAIPINRQVHVALSGGGWDTEAAQKLENDLCQCTNNV